MPPVSLVSGARKPHRKYGLCGLAPGADFAAVRLHYFSRDKEPQAQAALAVGRHVTSNGAAPSSQRGTSTDKDHGSRMTGWSATGV